MKIIRKAIIQAPIDKVWQISAEQFDSAYTWMTGVVHSSATHSNGNGNAPVGRVCTLETGDNPLHAVETVTHYDENDHVFVFNVVPKKKGGTGLPVSQNQVTIKLVVIDKQQTLLTWQSDVSLKPIGYLLYPILKFGLGKAFSGIVADLKHYAETGRVSASKQKELDKLSRGAEAVN